MCEILPHFHTFHVYVYLLMEPKPAPFPNLTNLPTLRQAVQGDFDIKSLELRNGEKQQNEGPRMRSYQQNSKHVRPDYDLNTGAQGAHNTRRSRLGADVKILL